MGSLSYFYVDFTRRIRWLSSGIRRIPPPIHFEITVSVPWNTNRTENIIKSIAKSVCAIF